MGPKASLTTAPGDYATLLKQHQIVRQVDSDGLFYLRNTNNGGYYLLREFTFNDKREFERYVQILQKMKSQLSGCQYVLPLEKVITRSYDQYCSTIYKIYALFEWTERTLEDEINQRNLQQRKFQEKELWSILASCIVGLSHLQKNEMKHQALRSNSILISQDGVIKIFDPIATGCQSNYDCLVARRSTPHVYLSPQLANALQMEVGQPHAHAYKSDIWTMGIIMLEAGLTQYQDEDYRDQSARVHWETIQYNINRFRQNYSEELTGLVEFMLSKEERNRPDWLQLEERVIKYEQSKHISRESNASRQSSGAYNGIVYNQHTENRFPEREGQGITATSNVGRVYQDSGMESKGLPGQMVSVQRIRQPLGESEKKHIVNTQPFGSNQPFGNPLPFTNSQLIGYNPHISSHPMPNPSSLAQFKPSNIDQTRPLRNIFPPNNYTTLTEVDQNLIVVPEEDNNFNASTPNNHINAYFDSTSRQKENGKLGRQQQQAQDSFTSSQMHRQGGKVAGQGNSYGMAMFQPQTQVYNKPLSPQVISAIPSPPSNSTLPQPAPQGGEYVVQHYKQGSEYKGYKWQGMRHGFGGFYYQDGGMYEGQWRFNKMQGKGKLFYQSGKLAYEGDWSNDQFEGFGKLFNEYPDVVNHPLNYRNFDEIEERWNKYEGQFNHDEKNGKGILYLTNGQFYEGQFHEDYVDGEGIYHAMSGEKVRGRWSRNILVE